MDKRIYELQDGNLELQTNLANLGIAIDADNFTNAKFLKLSSLLKDDRVISTDSANNYNAITPSSFLASTATETELGIIRYSTDNEISSKSGNNAIKASQIRLLWEAVNESGAMYNTWIQHYNISDCDISNLYYCYQSNIMHINGYIRAQIISNSYHSIKISVNTIPAPLPGTVSSINTYWLQDNIPVQLSGKITTENNRIVIEIFNNGAYFPQTQLLKNIYIQTSYIIKI